METRCPHCSRVQTVHEDMASASIRCEECRGMFVARQLPKISPIEEAVDYSLPQFSHWGPGWWITGIVIILALCAVAMVLTGRVLMALSFFASALTMLWFAMVLNYLGYIADLLRHGLTSKKRPK